MPDGRMNGEQFSDALAKAKNGDWIMYHSGCLMADRCYYPDADSVARAAWAAHEAGECLLVQCRVSLTSCQYFAVRLCK